MVDQKAYARRHYLANREKYLARAKAQAQRLKETGPPPIPDDKHGTLSGYDYYKCRCDQCRAISRERARARTGATPHPTEDQIPHGSRNKYRRGCRCDECVAAMREHAREGYRRGDPDQHRARRQAWAEANAERVSEYSRQRYEDNAEEERATRRAAYAAAPDAYKARARARQLRQREVTVELVSRQAVWDRDEGVCHICGLPADQADWHLDHVVAIDLGGEHSYANVKVSHPRCNRQKGNKPWPL